MHISDVTKVFLVQQSTRISERRLLTDQLIRSMTQQWLAQCTTVHRSVQCQGPNRYLDESRHGVFIRDLRECLSRRIFSPCDLVRAVDKWVNRD